MKFCPRCKSILVLNDDMLVCDCGYKEKSELKLREQIPEQKEIEIIEEEHTGESEIPIICWNCGNRGVYYWMVQMSRADEAPTRFYRCKTCKKVWRSSK
jgi:DNA-directed RNA polymerase subunit M